MSLARFAATVGGYTMLSRALGLVRDVLMAAVFGAGPVVEAFVIAFRVPNLFRRVVNEGAVVAAFVPLFSRCLETEGRAAARAFAEQTLAVLLSALLLFTVLVEIAMPGLMYVIAPGFVDEPDKFRLTIQFARVTFPSLLFLGLVALLGGVLNTLYRFAAPAAMPVVLNLFLIAALIAYFDVPMQAGHALVWAVAAAGATQFLWMVAACRRVGMRLALPRPRLTPGVRRLGRLILPLAFAAGAMQLNLLISTIMATLQEGAVGYIYFSARIYQLPLGVVGVAVGTALLPMLSRNLSSGATYAAMDNQARALEVSLLITLPAAAALMTMPEAIVRVLFERGQFGAVETEATAAALFAFALGLPAYVVVKVLSPGFFAREDMVTPLKVTLVSVATNAILCLALFWPMGHVGIALATALASWLHAGLFWLILKRRGHLEIDIRLKSRLPRMVLASALMAAVLWPLVMALAGQLAAGTSARIAALATLVIVGVTVFAIAAQLLGATRRGELRALLQPGS